MAGTRGLAQIRGEQIRSKALRDRHFDENFKLNENKVDIKWHDHREILEDTKIDVFVQVNDKAVAGLSSLNVTSVMGGRPVATPTTEGVVTGARVDIRKTGTEDFPYIDSDGDRVYGKIRYESGTSEYFLDFFSIQGGAETPYTFASDAPNIDFRYILRTNLSVIPVDALINGGSSFVEGATDAKAYMNLEQLKKDLYGGSGTLDGDGNANLATPIVQQIANEITARQQADQEIRDDLASTLAGEGASLIGVVTDPNYTGVTVQAVLSDLAARLKQAEDNVTILQTEDDRYVFEATGGETQVLLPGGKKARPNTLFVTLNGSLLAPGVNYEEIVDGEGKIIGVNFAPDTLSGGDPGNNIPPDVVFMWYKLA
jgi:hypothetical protein